MSATLRLCAIFFFGLLLRATVPQLTYVPSGPIHVDGNRLVDGTGHPFVLHGTAMPFRTPPQAAVLTASTFSQIGQRWNMNTLRLQISVAMDDSDPGYMTQVKSIVHEANKMQLVVMLAPHDENETNGEPTPRMVQFWQKWAAAFRDEPLVLFDLYSEPKAGFVPGFVPGTHTSATWQFWLRGGHTTDGGSSPGMQALADAVRGTGAKQVIVAMVLDENPLLAGFDTSDLLDDPNVVYEVCPLHADNTSDADRDQHFGIMSANIPVLANNWDLQLDKDNGECNSIPTTAGAAARLIQADLDYFDSHSISWTSSFFVAGKLIKDNVEFFPTQLNTSWTCGHPATPSAGMGETVRYHLWGAADDAAISVNGAAGGLAIAPGSVAVVYGQPVLTTANGIANLPPQAGPLAGTTVRLTDGAGKSRVAPLLYVAPSSINFVVPQDLSPGLIHVSVMNEGGPNLEGSMVVQPVAPGLFSVTGNGRGPVVGFTVEGDLPVFDCDALACTAKPIPLSKSLPMLIRLIGTGFRAVSKSDQLAVTIGGVAARIVSAGIFDEQLGTDQVVIAIGPEFAGMGEADLILSVGDQVANCVRINVQ